MLRPHDLTCKGLSAHTIAAPTESPGWGQADALFYRDAVRGTISHCLPLSSLYSAASVTFHTDFVVSEGIASALCEFQTQSSEQTVSSVRWTHNTTMQISTGQGNRITIETEIGEGRSDLEIDGVVQEDAGQYTCRVQFANPPETRTDTAILRVASEWLHEQGFI